MLGKRLINSNSAAAGGSCTTDTLQILGDTSCIAYYKMSDATDESGNYNGTPTSVNFNVAGKFGNAGDFNGSSSKITGTNPVFNTTTYSVSLWANVGGLKGANYNHWAFIINNDQHLVIGEYPANTLKIYVSDFTTSNAFYTISDASAWYNIVFTRNGNSISIYVNGTLANTFSYTGLSQGTGFKIGTNHVDNAFFDGKIDNVRIFNKALSSTEVTTLYNEVYCVPTIVPTDYFEPVIYSGAGGTEGVVSKIISSLNFQPDLVWIKSRNSAQPHDIEDSVRGEHRYISSNSTSAETYEPLYGVSSFDSNGFSIFGGGGRSNHPGFTYVAWCWKAGGADVLNEEGTIDSQVSANVDAGFSIVKQTSNNTNDTYGHGLDEAPEMIISKNMGVAGAWGVYHKDLGTGKFLYLNTTASVGTSSNVFPIVNDTVFSGGSTGWNNLTYNYINYCFHSVDGFSKIGSYVGNGSTNGTMVLTGFRPAFVMIKRTVGAGDWLMFDNKINTTNPLILNLVANTSGAEQNNVNYRPNFLSNGFSIAGTSAGINANGETYIFMAIAEEVFVPEIPFEGGDFNGLDYQLVTNSTTGRTWLDRNLGATRVATSSTDSNAFGHYYQWGRLSDGHQIPTSSTTSTLSGGDVPGNSNFITSTVSPKDWRSPQNSSLWQGPQSYNNPCPPGFRLPTEAEILEEAASWSSQNSAGAFASNLKLPTGSGIRIETGGVPVDTGAGYIWTSTISGTDAKFYYVASGGDFTSNYRRAAGCPVRPIKNE